jgi:RecG-like helicase
MKSEAKDFEMKRFLKGETSIMVATTVIEVGVDVPNASVMVIEMRNGLGYRSCISYAGVWEEELNNPFVY